MGEQGGEKGSHNNIYFMVWTCSPLGYSVGGSVSQLQVSLCPWCWKAFSSDGCAPLPFVSLKQELPLQEKSELDCNAFSLYHAHVCYNIPDRWDLSAWHSSGPWEEYSRIQKQKGERTKEHFFRKSLRPKYMFHMNLELAQRFPNILALGPSF